MINAARYALITRRASYLRKIDEARAILERAFSTYGDWMVAFSGGKDFTVALDLAMSVNPDISVVWLDDGWDYPETIQYIADTEQRIGRHIVRVSVPVTAAYWKETPYPGDDPTREHPSDMDYNDWTHSCNTVVGLRKQENNYRRIILNKHGSLYHSATYEHINCAPLLNWGWDEVWGYIAANGIPYNPVYDKLLELGVPLNQSRVGPLTAYMVWKMGFIAELRAGWPMLYHRFAAAFPEVGRLT